MAVRTLIDSGKYSLISSLALILNRQATKVGVLRASHKIFLSLRVKFE
jgi:hypothetical protein